MNIGRTLRLLRKSLQITLDEVAEWSGVSVSKLSRIETSLTKKIDILDLVAITKALGITVDELTGLTKKIDTEEIRQAEQKLREAEINLEQAEAKTIPDIREFIKKRALRSKPQE